MAKSPITLDRWRETSLLHHDRETGLPKILGLWSMSLTRANGVWQLHTPDGELIPLETKDAFIAYRAMVDAYEAWFRTMPRKHVYFIGEKADLTAKVKIGVAVNPHVRLRTLQIGHPETLHVLAVTEGGEELERAYHHRFARMARRGEWFVINREILNEIERLSA